MPAGQYDITIEKGATFSLTLTWKDENGDLVNLTGYTARLQVRRSHSSSAAMLDLTTENSGISLGGSAGTIQITATATATGALTGYAGVYDLELVAAGGTITRLLEGAVTIAPEVTR